MHVLIWSDFQLHTFAQFGDGAESLSKRLHEQQAILQQIHDINKSRNIDLGIFGGDFVHATGRHPTEVLLIAQKYFEDDRTPYIFVDGNHDLINTVRPTYWQNVANVMRAFAAKPPKDLFGLKIKLVNYQDEIDYETLRGFDIVVLHKQPQLVNDHGFVMEGVDWQRIAERNRLVFFGHDHNRKQLADNCWVIGCPMHLNFGDKGDRGVYIVDTEGWSVDFVKLKYPEFRVVEHKREASDDGNYYKVLKDDGTESTANTIVVKTPPVFQERIKANDFKGVLSEWVKINGKDETYLQMIEDIVQDKMEGVRKFFDGRLASVQIQDFMSAGDVSYDIKNGLVFVQGGDGEQGSNGQGKTTITGEAIYWALFGETTKGMTGDDVIQYGKNNCRVTLILESADRHEEIVVTRTRKLGLVVIKRKEMSEAMPLTEGLRQADRQKILEQILGFDKYTFLASCYFSQENLLMLTGMTDGEKTDMITGLLGFEEYDDLYERTADKSKDFLQSIEDLTRSKDVEENDATVLRSKIDQNNMFVAGMEQEIAGIRTGVTAKKDQAEAAKRELAEMKEPDKNRLSEFRMQLEDTAQMKQKAQKVLEGLDVAPANAVPDSRIGDLKKKIGELVGEGMSIQATIKRCREEIQALEIRPSEIHINKLNELNQKTGRIEAAVEEKLKAVGEIEKSIIDIRSQKKGVRCDKCGAEVTEENIELFVKERVALREKLDKELKALSDEMNAVVAGMGAVYTESKADMEKQAGAYTVLREASIKAAEDRDKEVQAEIIKCHEEVEQLEANKAGIKDEKAKYVKKISKLDEIIEDLHVLIERASKEETEYKMKKQSKKAAITSLEALIEADESRITGIEGRIRAIGEMTKGYKTELESKEKVIKDIVWQIDKAEKGMYVLDFWKVAFSSKGIRAVLLDRFCNDFNSVVNDYLAMASNGSMSIAVSPVSVTKGGEERNKIGMQIMMADREAQYKTLSGGEKRRVDVSLCLALNKFIANKNGLASGLLGIIILDEMFSYIDRVGEEAMAGILWAEAENKAVIVISHTPELSSYAKDIWRVVKKDGVSMLETA